MRVVFRSYPQDPESFGCVYFFSFLYRASRLIALGITGDAKTLNA